MTDPFKQAEEQFFRLKGRFAARRITREQFDAALKELIVQDANKKATVFLKPNGQPMELTFKVC